MLNKYFNLFIQKNYRIAGYLHRVQLLWMASIYHEPVIFTDVLFATGCIIVDI